VRFFLQHPLTNPFPKVNVLGFKEDETKKQENSTASERHHLATDAEKSILLHQEALAHRHRTGRKV
jgi:hypothetical protein